MVKLSAWKSERGGILPESDQELDVFYADYVRREIVERKRGRGIIGLISNCRSKYRNSIVRELSNALTSSQLNCKKYLLQIYQIILCLTRIPRHFMAKLVRYSRIDP